MPTSWRRISAAARRAALLHAIGELGASDAVRDQDGVLDDERWIEMHNRAALPGGIPESGLTPGTASSNPRIAML